MARRHKKEKLEGRKLCSVSTARGFLLSRCLRDGFYVDAIEFRIKHGAWVIDLHIVGIAGRHGLVAAVLTVGIVPATEKYLHVYARVAICWVFRLARRADLFLFLFLVSLLSSTLESLSLRGRSLAALGIAI